MVLWMRRFTILANSITELYFATVVNAGCVGIGSSRDEEESMGESVLTASCVRTTNRTSLTDFSYQHSLVSQRHFPRVFPLRV